MPKEQKENGKLKTPEFRTTYAHVWSPGKMGDDGKWEQISVDQGGRYGVCMLFPKKDKKVMAWLKEFKAMCEKRAKEEYPRGLPSKFRVSPIRDGDVDRSENEAFKGMYFINCTSKIRPGIVDTSNPPEAIIDQDDFYSGCWARATLNLFCYSNSGNKGVGVGLRNLQKTRDDDRLGGGSSAEDDFAEDGGSDEDDDDLL